MTPSKSNRGPEPGEQELYELITAAILSKQLRPGSRLKELALAEQFGFSRARVRRVLEKLAELKMVEFKLNVGALVRQPTPSEAKAVFATRRVLEAEAVRSAIAVATVKELKRLKSLVASEQQAFQTHAPGVLSLSSEFHLLLGELSGNEVLSRILRELVHQCVLIQALYERQSQHTICLVNEHEQLVDYLLERKVKPALDLMMRHLDHIEQSLDYAKGSAMDERLARSIS